jgi:hypothetical protein
MDDVDYQGLPYDLYSIMHYDNYAFSKNGQPTIVAKKPGVTLLPSYKKFMLTQTDVAEIKRRYNC